MGHVIVPRRLLEREPMQSVTLLGLSSTDDKLANV